MKVNINLIFSIITFHILLCGAVKVKINKGFFEVQVSQNLNGDEWKDIKVKLLHFLPNDNANKSVQSVENFKELCNIFINNNSLIKIPKLNNLPALRNISLSRNNISVIKESYFADIQYSTNIFLSRNIIHTIEDSSFPSLLIYITLRCNQLTQVSSRWFNTPGSLWGLDLAGNKISAIRKSLFEKFYQLGNLDLSNNRIASIDAGAFAMATNMLKMVLRSNLLTELPGNVFAGSSISIYWLDLRYNRLTYLTEDLIKTLYGFRIAGVFTYFQMKNISLHGNPWQCPCLNKIENLLNDYGVVQRESLSTASEPKCLVSLYYPKVCIEHVDPELFDTYSKWIEPKEYKC